MMDDTTKPIPARSETCANLLDEALEETFPASDPPAVVLPRESGLEDTAAERACPSDDSP